jgi:excisionase family DNA binding protein
MGALEDWLTVKEAAEYSGYHYEHIRRLIRAGEISARKWGNAWMVSRESLLQYLVRVKSQGGKRGPKSEIK